ncbi:hypothetical protein SprV_0401543500 [Sparganum proliferum]
MLAPAIPPVTILAPRDGGDAASFRLLARSLQDIADKKGSRDCTFSFTANKQSTRFAAETDFEATSPNLEHLTVSRKVERGLVNLRWRPQSFPL